MQTISIVITLLLGILGLSFLVSWPVMMLWNGCLVPAVSVVSEISWLQAWGLVVLFRTLFTSSSFNQS